MWGKTEPGRHEAVTDNPVRPALMQDARMGAEGTYAAGAAPGVPLWGLVARSAAVLAQRRADLAAESESTKSGMSRQAAGSTSFPLMYTP